LPRREFGDNQPVSDDYPIKLKPCLAEPCLALPCPA